VLINISGLNNMAKHYEVPMGFEADLGIHRPGYHRGFLTCVARLLRATLLIYSLLQAILYSRHVNDPYIPISRSRGSQGHFHGHAWRGYRRSSILVTCVAPTASMGPLLPGYPSHPPSTYIPSCYSSLHICSTPQKILQLGLFIAYTLKLYRSLYPSDPI